jgi:hypothetical protein
MQTLTNYKTLLNLLIGTSLVSALGLLAYKNPVASATLALPMLPLSIEKSKVKGAQNDNIELIRTLRKSIKDLSDNEINLKIQLEKLQTNHQTATQAYNLLDSERKSLDEKLRVLEKERNELKGHTTQWSVAYNELKNDRDKLSKKVNEASQDLTSLSDRIEQYRDALERANTIIENSEKTIESLKMDEYQLDNMRRQQYELRALEAEFNADKRVFQKDIENLNRDLDLSRVELNNLQNRYDADVQTAYSQGYDLAVQKSIEKIKNLELDLKIATLELEGRQALIKINQALKTVADVVDTDYRPIIASGEPRSGKAQIILSVLKEYGRTTGVIPFVYDRSEGGESESTWNRANVPSFKSFEMFLNILRSVEHNKARRPMLHEKASKDLAPIVLIFDESKTSLNGLSNEEIDEFAELFNVLKYEVIKRKVILCMVSCSYQIQNLKAGKHQLFNGGELSDVHLFLNNQNVTKFYRDKAKKTEFNDEWIQANEGKYISAYVKDDSTEVQLVALKHPTHDGNLRSEKTANTPVTGIKLADINKQANWLPTEAKALYMGYFSKQIESQSSSQTEQKTHNDAQNAQSKREDETLEPLPDNALYDCTVSENTIEPDDNGVWAIDKISLSNIPLNLWTAILDCEETQTNAIKSLFNVSSGGRNKRYLKAREIYQKVKNNA